ncbi:MAG: UDP-N-acetylmuramoyl-tripeptide--D-alanyl-D-alanine ligase [Propionibacteriaceae bacterium]|nr:UDP-N-acetylmuramoyl-tripeptide--D-alanyl-D-alanine ligase [Propionibacteriaceae bacterium]
MQPMRAARLAELAGGHLTGDPGTVIGPDVLIDSRAITPGSLFVAIAGERFDGHEFCRDAVEAGAAAVLVSRQLELGVPQIVVADTVAGLSALARGVVAQERQRGMICVGITGSSGKTSTKDLLAQVLADAAPTVAPPGSLNNEIGVPLTCCRADAQTAYLVNELGARGIGHIAWLTSIAPPDIALVLNVGVAHLGEFGGVDATAQAKGELVEALGGNGWAILNADDPRVAAMAGRTSGRIGYFSVGDTPRQDAELQVCAAGVTLDGLGHPRFTLRVETADHKEEHPVSLSLTGAHHAANAAAAAAAAIAAGVEPGAVADSLSRASVRSAWRMAVTERADGVLIVNDSYNANPDSMAAALDALHHLHRARLREYPRSRAFAVLGDMLELGDGSAALHRQLGASAQVSEVLAVGDFADDIVAGAAGNGVAGRKVGKEEVAAALDLRPGDVVLLKASRGVGLETVAQQLTEGESA